MIENFRKCTRLKESIKTITNNEELVKIFNKYFSNVVPNPNIILRIIYPAPILLIQFSVKSKSMKLTQAFSKLRKWWLKETFHFPLNLLIETKYLVNYKN